MAFAPRVDETIIISNQKLSFCEDPGESGVVLKRLGTKAQVFKLQDELKSFYALKVFSLSFRNPRYYEQAEKIAKYGDIQGLLVCQRIVIRPMDFPELMIAHPELRYAVLMPWIEGVTWAEAKQKNGTLTSHQAQKAALALADILFTMENRTIAHCNLDASNVMIETRADGNVIVQLIGIEGMFAPDLEKPESSLAVSAPYAHPVEGIGQWAKNADRYTGAILLAEILGISELTVNPDKEGAMPIKQISHDRKCMAARELVDKAKKSRSLNDSPSFTGWVMALKSDAMQNETEPQNLVRLGDPTRKQDNELNAIDQKQKIGLPTQIGRLEAVQKQGKGYWRYLPLAGLLLILVFVVWQNFSTKNYLIAALAAEPAVVVVSSTQIVETTVAAAPPTQPVKLTKPQPTVSLITASTQIPTSQPEKAINLENIGDIEKIGETIINADVYRANYVSISPSGKIIRNESTNEFVDLASGELVFQPPDDITYGFVSPNGRFFYGHSWSNQYQSVYIYDILEQTKINEIQGNSIGRSDDNSRLALKMANDGQYEVRVLDTDTVEQRTIWTGRNDIEEVSFSTNGDMIAIKELDQAHILKNGQVIQTIDVAYYGSLTFSEDNSIVAGTVNEGVRIWDVESGILIEKFIGKKNNARFQFSGDIPTIAVNITLDYGPGSGKPEGLGIIYDYQQRKTICQISMRWANLAPLPGTKYFYYEMNSILYLIDSSKGCEVTRQFTKYDELVPVISNIVALGGKDATNGRSSSWELFDITTWEQVFSLGHAGYEFQVTPNKQHIVFLQEQKGKLNIQVYGLK